MTDEATRRHDDDANLEILADIITGTVKVQPIARLAAGDPTASSRIELVTTKGTLALKQLAEWSVERILRDEVDGTLAGKAEDLARAFGWNPEAAEARGGHETGLGAWFYQKLPGGATDAHPDPATVTAIDRNRLADGIMAVMSNYDDDQRAILGLAVLVLTGRLIIGGPVS